MDRTAFIDVATPGWWLIQPRLDPPLDESRRKVGECWGWRDEDRWFAKPDDLGKVFQFLLDTKGALLDQLDQLQDVYQREKWCNDLIEAWKAGQDQAAKAAGQEAAQTSAETAAAPAPPPAPPAPPAPKKPSAFANKDAPATEPAVQSASDGGAETPPPPPLTVAELEETISGLAEDPAIPISKEELKAAVEDPDFGAKLEAAERELEDELQSELASELEAELAAFETEE